ncbi:MAG: metal ABC transporter ATP-binding protein [Rhodobacteraceae bacterium]|nr:metal ABC transporter ATP-binding protein [Paracoccaceae bacterium]
MSDALITVSGLGFSADSRRILHDIDFAIQPGEIVTIVGPNGSGKSSFLKCLIGALGPQTGTITRRKGLKIGYVPQKLHLDQAFPMSVERFLRLGSRVPQAERDAIVERLGLRDVLTRQVAELSGGQLQRVLLAHALIGRPHLLILDEAAQGLDQPAVAGFYRLVEDVRRDLGCAILMVSHDLHVVMSASDRVICLNGHVCCEGTPTIVSAAPEYRRLFGHGTEGALALYRHEHDHAHDHAGHDHAG